MIAEQKILINKNYEVFREIQESLTIAGRNKLTT